jgi:hypothetical protein
MKIKKSTIKEEGACNFCNKGVITENGLSLTFPYEQVIHLEGKRISAVFCEECFDDIQNYKLT